MTGHDGTVASLKQLYRDAGVLESGAGLPTELALTLDDAEEITGHSFWWSSEHIGIDEESPAPCAEALARLVVAIRDEALVWRAQEVS